MLVRSLGIRGRGLRIGAGERASLTGCQVAAVACRILGEGMRVGVGAKAVLFCLEQVIVRDSEAAGQNSDAQAMKGSWVVSFDNLG